MLALWHLPAPLASLAYILYVFLLFVSSRKGVIVRRVSRGACSSFRRVFCGVRVGVCCGRSRLRLGG